MTRSSFEVDPLWVRAAKTGIGRRASENLGRAARAVVARRDRPTVETSSGRVKGAAVAGVLRFAGVPYAASPTGARRFLPPAPHPGWTGVRDALAFGNESPQVLAEPLAPAGLRRGPYGEDCLVLDVYTPSLTGDRPVMVWLHGGAFVTGSGSRQPFDGSSLARHGDVVVVSVTYRLGPFGWLYLGHLDDSLEASGNLGLLDQLAALRWVRDNAHQFGGDGSRIMLFGTSAGAMCVAALLGTGEGADLVSSAALQSGAAHFSLSLDQVVEHSDRVRAELGAHDVTSLRRLPAEQLVEANHRIEVAAGLARAPSLGRFLDLGPVVDGRVLSEAPLAAWRRGDVRVPVIVGTNADEASLFEHFAGPLTAADLTTWLERLAGDRAGVLLDTYRAEVGADPRRIKVAISTDRLIRVPVVRLAEAMAGHGQGAYLYEFRWHRRGSPLGACHSLEQQFVFDNLQPWKLAKYSRLTGLRPPRTLAAAMRDAWTRHAWSGDPNHDDLPAWHPFGSEPSQMVFDSPCASTTEIGEARIRAWDGLIP